mmetsp:Transcript_24715/g.43221  ORF Transcript_24715/g.43221 Transcript_24715/m.43221 type:complete len:550 (-) Transcript_24715:49-1698(-)
MHQAYRPVGVFFLLHLACVSGSKKSDAACESEEEMTALLQRSNIEVLAHSGSMTHGALRRTLGIAESDGLLNFSDINWNLLLGDNQTQSDLIKALNDSTKTSNSTSETNGSITSETDTDKNSGPVVTKKEKVTVGAPGENTAPQPNTTGEDSKKPFVNVNTTKKTYNVSTDLGRQTRQVTVETTEVTIATPKDIIKVHLLFFIPLSILWSIYFYTGRKERVYMVILPISLCIMMVTQDLVNQSLAIVTKAPLGITACQASFMVLVTGVWSASVDSQVIKASDPWVYFRWCFVAVLFTIYQLVNHLVSFKCSLSERTVFNNLCPVVTIIFETFLMPASLKPKMNTSIMLSLASLVTGALLFSFASPEFTGPGILVALLMVVATVPYRLLQRGFLSDSKPRSIVFLAFIDGLFVFTVSFVTAFLKHKDFLTDLLFWFKHPSIFVMLVLSALTFAGTHLCGLALLRVSSATAYVVFQSLASFIEVALGILFFGDTVFGTPMACIGLGLSLASGLWYSSEVSGNGKGFLLPPPTGGADRAFSAPVGPTTRGAV